MAKKKQPADFTSIFKQAIEQARACDVEPQVFREQLQLWINDIEEEIQASEDTENEPEDDDEDDFDEDDFDEDDDKDGE